MHWCHLCVFRHDCLGETLFCHATGLELAHGAGHVELFPLALFLYGFHSNLSSSFARIPSLQCARKLLPGPGKECGKWSYRSLGVALCGFQVPVSAHGLEFDALHVVVKSSIGRNAVLTALLQRTSPPRLNSRFFSPSLPFLLLHQ